jgi:hypothetical protein
VTVSELKIARGVLTTPSTAITKEVAMEAAEGSVSLRFEYDRDGVIYGGGVRFHRVRAYRFRTESLCTAWHIEGVYDTVAEIEDSQWVAELTTTEPRETAGFFEMRHYMLFIDSAGCFEVVGASWSLLPDARIE